MILHLDLDTFFVSAERMRNKALEGKPVIVGGRGDPFIFDKKPAHAKKAIHANSGAFVPTLYHANYDHKNYFFENSKIRGIVVTSSYEARKFGVKTGMTIKEALMRCPQATLLPPDHLHYHSISSALVELLRKEAPVVEQYSIDEMFIDVNGWIEESALQHYMENLQQKITTTLHVPASLGASNGKWVAKLATSFAKPYGIKIVQDEQIFDFVKEVDVNQFPGVGKAFSKKFKLHKIQTIGEAIAAKTLMESWGRQGRDLYKKFLGIDNEGVNPKQDRKGVGISRSMDTPIRCRKEFYRRVSIMIRHWTHTIIKLKLLPTTYCFGIGYDEGYRSKKQFTSYRLFNETFIQQFAREKFKELDLFPNLAIRYIRISATKFLHHDPKALNLIEYQNDRKHYTLSKQLFKSREKYGMDIVRNASEIVDFFHNP